MVIMGVLRDNRLRTVIGMFYKDGMISLEKLPSWSMIVTRSRITRIPKSLRQRKGAKGRA